MAKMIPFRSSIEIECNNSLSLRKNTVEICWHSDWKKLANKFKLTDYSDDNMSKKGPTEHRISISNYKQLTGLYNTLLEMKKHCLLNPSSGIHIHIDLHPFFDSVEWKLMGYENRKDLRRKMINYFNTRLDSIEEIFGDYKGGYNSRGAAFNKGSWIRLCEEYQSAEFRIGGMTFEYETIIKWIIGCNKEILLFYKKFGIDYKTYYASH